MTASIKEREDSYVTEVLRRNNSRNKFVNKEEQLNQFKETLEAEENETDEGRTKTNQDSLCSQLSRYDDR